MVDPLRSAAPPRALQSAKPAGADSGPRTFSPERSPTAREPGATLASAAAALARQPAPVDLDRVAELRSALADGRYQLDPQRTAAALLGDNR